MPQYDPHEDEIQNQQTFSPQIEELEPMSEVGDHYIGAEILLPREDEMAMGHVVLQGHDACGNMMGRIHIKTKLDTIMYQVIFAGGEVTELTAN